MREEDTVVTTEAQLTTYYSIYCPEKVGNINKILKLFNGQYDVLNEKTTKGIHSNIFSVICVYIPSGLCNTSSLFLISKSVRSRKHWVILAQCVRYDPVSYT